MALEVSDAIVPKEIVDLDMINSKLVHSLKQLQLNRIRKEIEFHQKVHDLQVEFDAGLVEFDNKRASIISGAYVPTEEETKYEFADPTFPEPSEPKEKGIPHFWPIIFHNLDLISEMISEADEPIINHLADVRYVLLKEPRGFKIEFEFSENEFFTNKVLSKEYYYSDDVDVFEPLQHEGLILKSAVGCKIDWKADKDVTQKKVTKKMKHKSDNQIKTVEKLEKADSFFNFFDPPTGPIADMSEDDKELLVADFDIGETLRHSVIPRAIIYFTGEGIDDDDEYDEEMDEEDFDEFDEDDDDLDDEEDEEEEEGGDSAPAASKKSGGSKSSKSGSRGKGGKGGKTEVPPECKQQ